MHPKESDKHTVHPPFYPLHARDLVEFCHALHTGLQYNIYYNIVSQQIPNRLFYDGELKPMADEMKTNNLCKWEELPSKDFPLIFHGVQGKDEREETSPSFFNTAEATTVMDYVRKLLDARSFGVTPEEIGIISPYRQQVCCFTKHICSQASIVL